MTARYRFALAACHLTVLGLAAQTPPQVPAASKPAAAAKPVREPGVYSTLVTSLGTVVIKMYDKESPITVKNFSDLAMGRKLWPDPKTGQPVKRPLYNGLIFHRVIPDFMIQGGDPLGTGMGGTQPIPDEFHPSLSFDRAGLLAMANAGPGTGSSQFFITDGPTPHLTGKHTIFGLVVEGQEVVSKIARVPRDPNDDRPRTPVRIVRLTVAREGPPVPSTKPAAKKPVVAKPGVAKPGAAKPGAAKPGAAKPGVAKPKPGTVAPKKPPVPSEPK